MLNDSKEIAATLYLSSAILAVVLIISVALPTHLSIYSAGYSFGIPLATSVVLIVVFFTKVGLSTSAFISFFLCVCEGVDRGVSKAKLIMCKRVSDRVCTFSKISLFN